VPQSIQETHDRLDAIGREHEAPRDGDTVLDAGAVTIAEVLGIDPAELEEAALERIMAPIRLVAQADVLKVSQVAGILKACYVDAFLAGVATGRGLGS
jgi:hypothetical protein